MMAAMLSSNDLCLFLSECIDARNAVFKKCAPALSLDAARRALQSWGGDISSITHIVAVTCTGVMVPGLEFHIMTGLGLPKTTQRLAVQFMGCFGALSGMKTARAFAAERYQYNSNPYQQSGKSSVLISSPYVASQSTESCSACMHGTVQLAHAVGECTDRQDAALCGWRQLLVLISSLWLSFSIFCHLCSLSQDARVDNLVGSALFSDGSGALVIGSNPQPPQRALFLMHGNASVIVDDTLDMMSWELTSTGMTIGLGKEIPAHIYKHIDAFARELLDGTEAQGVPYDKSLWALHPG
jgi:predicted naringenin-chalcone synthase